MRKQNVAPVPPGMPIYNSEVICRVSGISTQEALGLTEVAACVACLQVGLPATVVEEARRIANAVEAAEAHVGAEAAPPAACELAVGAGLSHCPLTDACRLQTGAMHAYIPARSG